MKIKVETFNQGMNATMRHRAITATVLFCAWYILDEHYHYAVAAKGVEIAIFPYADALIKQLTGIIE